MVVIGDTTINWTDSCTLGLIMKTLALCAFICDDIVDIIVHGLLRFTRIDLASARRHDGAAQRGAVREPPFLSTLIDRIVRALGFTGPAIDAFIRDLYRHASCFLCQAPDLLSLESIHFRKTFRMQESIAAKQFLSSYLQPQ